MAMAKRRKVPGVNPFPAYPAPFEKASDLKKRRTEKRNSSIYERIFGGKGEGKTYVSMLLADHMKKELEKKVEDSVSNEPKVAVITDEELKELNEPARNYFEAAGYFISASGGGGGSSDNPHPSKVSDFIKQQAYQHEQQSNPWQPPQQQQQQPNWNQPPGYWKYDTYAPWMNDDTAEKATARKKKKEELEESKKQEYTAEDFKGRFCAVVTIELKPVLVYTGVLFVKKCGHWKLMDFNGNKLSGGKAGSFEELLRSGQMKIEIHKTLYDAEPPQMDNMDLEIV